MNTPVLHGIADRIESDEQALRIATELATLFKQDAAQRDQHRTLPWSELEQFSQSGLWAITVPKALGGAEVSSVTLAKVIAIIAAADGSLGQIPQNHYYALEVLRVNGSTEQQRKLYTEVLAGARYGNALAEIGTKTVLPVSHLTGTVSRSTGASSMQPAHCMLSASPPRLWMTKASSGWPLSRAPVRA